MKKQTKFYLIGGIAVAILLIIIFGQYFQFLAVITANKLNCNSNDGQNIICTPENDNYYFNSGDERSLNVGGVTLQVNAYDLTANNMMFIGKNIISRDIPQASIFFNTYSVCASGSGASQTYFRGTYSQATDDASKLIANGQLERHDNPYNSYPNTGTLTACGNSPQPYSLWRPDLILTGYDAYAIAEATASDRLNYTSKIYFLMRCDLTKGAYSTCTTSDLNKYISNPDTSNIREAVRITFDKISLYPVKGLTDEKFEKICPVNGVHYADSYCENNQIVISKTGVNTQPVTPVQEAVEQIVQNVTLETTDEQIIQNTQNVIENSDLTSSEKQEVIETISDKYDVTIPENPNYVIWILVGLISVIVLMVVILLIRRR